MPWLEICMKSYKLVSVSTDSKLQPQQVLACRIFRQAARRNVGCAQAARPTAIINRVPDASAFNNRNYKREVVGQHRAALDSDLKCVDRAERQKNCWDARCGDHRWFLVR